MLSVSRCPVAWRQIARLGGNQLWEMKSAGVFIDVLALGQKKFSAVRRDIEEWGAATGLSERIPAWKSWSFDEDGEWYYTTHGTREEAESEIEEALADGETRNDGKPLVEEFSVLSLLQKGKDRALLSTNGVADDFDLLVGFWAEDVLRPSGIRVDGLWWKETYDPSSMSAPRGGVFREAIPSWGKREIDWSEAPDDETLLRKKMKRTEIVRC